MRAHPTSARMGWNWLNGLSFCPALVLPNLQPHPHPFCPPSPPTLSPACPLITVFTIPRSSTASSPPLCSLLRNLSSADAGRQTMRNYTGLIDSLMAYVQNCVAASRCDDKVSVPRWHPPRPWTPVLCPALQGPGPPQKQ